MMPDQVTEQPEDNSLNATSPSPPNHGSAADDFALMEGIAARRQSALQQMYDKHAPLVLALCVRVLNDRGEAEDVLGAVFWELWDRADRYDVRRGSPLTYLTTLARSRAIDRRRAKGKTQPVGIDSVRPASAPPRDNPESGAMENEHRALVNRALGELDPAQRQAIESAFYDGLSHAEVAKQLGKPLGTIKTNIRKGLIRLRQSLRITYGGDT